MLLGFKCLHIAIISTDKLYYYEKNTNKIALQKFTNEK